MAKELKVCSLFSGCGGLDLGFTKAGFKLAFANDNDKSVWETFEKNHHLKIDKRSIAGIKSNEIPKADGIIGGPPCQSWSLAGKMRGANDQRGQLFYEYVRVIKDKQPLFFVAENVPGIISKTHLKEFKKLLNEFEKVGYNVNYKLMDSRDYGVPQERKRVIIVGYNKKLKKRFEFPAPTHAKEPTKNILGKTLKPWATLKEVIGDMPKAKPAKEKNKKNKTLRIPNHEYMNGNFSTIFMSRNRRKNWCDQSYTIQAGGRHAPLHPSSTKMRKVEEDKWEFEGVNPKYRRLSVREAARIQTFPDNFIFYYDNVAEGYKLVGNAVPVKLAEAIAKKIKKDLQLF
jgi:DNA (cytosine-5)-methyltransferase 1